MQESDRQTGYLRSDTPREEDRSGEYYTGEEQKCSPLKVPRHAQRPSLAMSAGRSTCQPAFGRRRFAFAARAQYTHAPCPSPAPGSAENPTHGAVRSQWHAQQQGLLHCPLAQNTPPQHRRVQLSVRHGVNGCVLLRIEGAVALRPEPVPVRLEHCTLFCYNEPSGIRDRVSKALSPHERAPPSVVEFSEDTYTYKALPTCQGAPQSKNHSHMKSKWTERSPPSSRPRRRKNAASTWRSHVASRGRLVR